jgi:hypothetical protein
VILDAISIPDLSPLGHWAGFDFPALLGKRGTLGCISNTKISSVALRFLGNAMSSMPLIANSATTSSTRSMALPHFAAGGGFVTGLYILNIGNQPANYSISFYDDAGKSAALSFAGLGIGSTLHGTIPAYGAAYVEADSPSSAALSGSGTITADSPITIQTLFRRRGADGTYNEVAVPATAGSIEVVIPFDDTVFTENGSQIYTWLALVNMDSQQSAHLTCTARDSQGTVIPNAIPPRDLNPRGHWAEYNFPALLGKRGTLDCTSKAKIGAVALRFLGNVMSSLPIAVPASASKEFRGTQFSFRYPATFTVVSAGADPDNSGFTLVRLAPTDGSPEKLEVRYSAHRPDEVGWPDKSQIITGTFALRQVGGIGPLDSHFFDTEVSGSGHVITTTDTYKQRSGQIITVIGSLIWSRFDAAQIDYAYDASVVSADARDLVLNTLAFTTKPSVLGDWVADGNELFFNPDSTVDISLADPAFPALGTSGAATGRYSIKDGRLLVTYIDFYGATILRTCQYGVDLGHFHFDCGSGTVSTLHTKPDLNW